MTRQAISTVGLISAMLLVLVLFPACEKGGEKSGKPEKTAKEKPESLQVLEALHAAQAGYFDEHGSYAASFDNLGWKPEGGSGYALFLPGDSIQPDEGNPVHLPGGLKALASDKGFTAIAAANIDDDPVLDVWWINDSKGVRHVVDDSSF